MVNKSQNKIELYPLGKCKDVIKKMLADDSDVVDLLLGENNPEVLLYDLDDILFGNTGLKLEGQIKDVLFVDTTLLTSKTYIMMDTIVSNMISAGKFKNITVRMNVFTHSSLLKLSNTEATKYKDRFYGNRIDCLIDAIARCLDGSKKFGIGELQLSSGNPVSIVQPDVKYYGKTLSFTFCDF